MGVRWVNDFDSVLAKAGVYDERKHPRHPKGSGRNAGQFAPKGGGQFGGRYATQGSAGMFQGRPILIGSYEMSRANATEEVRRIAPLMNKVAAAWKREILRNDPESEIEIRGTKDFMGDLSFGELMSPSAWIELSGKNGKGQNFLLGVSLFPSADGNTVKMNDSGLPPNLRRKGIFSTGLAVLMRPEFRLNGKLSVHHSTNDKAWQRIADKFGFSWKAWQEGQYVNVPDKDLILFLRKED